MNPDQIFEMFNALSDNFEIKHRNNLQDWYVQDNCHICKFDGVVIGSYGNGISPEEALKDHYRKYVTELGNAFIFIQNRSDEHKPHYYRWNGFMWKEYTREEAKRLVDVYAN